VLEHIQGTRRDWLRWIAGCVTLALLTGCDKGSNDISATMDVVEAPVTTAPPLDPNEYPILKLGLRVGDRFPLFKTISQEVRTPVGLDFEVSTSRLDLQMIVSVEEHYHNDSPQPDKPDPREGQIRMQVRYGRVKFVQEVGNRRIVYDSENTPRRIPIAAVGYHGLKNNAFQFWLSPTNEVLENVGFDQFLDRCVQHVPPEYRLKARAALATTTGSDGLANFVDESIGLLPNKAVRRGESWDRNRTIIQPVPMHLEQRYTVGEITPTTVTLDMLGTVVPAAMYGENVSGREDVQVSIIGGHCYGTLIVHRATGLPIEGKTEQVMQMVVTQSDGQEFEQVKRSTTTLRAFIPSALDVGTSELAKTKSESGERSNAKRSTTGTTPSTRTGVRTAGTEEPGGDESPSLPPAPRRLKPAKRGTTIQPASGSNP
jgi:hypothetical protein